MSDNIQYEIEGTVFDIEYFIMKGQEKTLEQEGYDAELCIENVYHAGEEMPAFICEHVQDNYDEKIFKHIKEEDLL
ncbi:MAG: hypothetical protein GY853_01980 [PVC group bacterium]|nr:hypothetical protein [PVC group bacterium]